MSDSVLFYHHPMSRGRVVRWMLEETGAPYEVKLIDLQKGEQKSSEYLAVNPMGKVPAIVHRGVVVTETAAICAYLADAFPAAKLAPAPDDPARGTYFRWMFFGAGCLEPALMNRMFFQATTDRSGTIGYGTYEDTLNALEKALQPGPYILGERFSAADVVIGAQIVWGTMVQSLEPRPLFQEYSARCLARPASKRAAELDDQLLAQSGKPAG